MASMAQIFPLIILILVAGGGAYVGYHIYLWSNELADRGKKKMEKKNMSFTKDGGLKVGVKEVRDEAYADKTQNVLVNVWNSSGVQSKTQPLTSRASSTSSTARPDGSSTSSRPNVSQSVSGNLATPAHRSSQRGNASPVPGSFD